MPSNYPTASDNLPAGHVDDVGELILALHVNRLDEAVNALMTELGNLPSGSYSSVRARLDATGEGVPSVRDDRDLLTVADDGSTVWSAKAAPYNVREAGAVGDASTNDTAAFNTAIAAAAGNGPCLVPPGTYVIGGVSSVNSLLMKSRSHLRSLSGAAHTVLKTPANGVTQQMIRNDSWPNGGATNDDIIIEGLTLDGNRATRQAHTPSTGLIEFRGTTGDPGNRWVVKDCTVHEQRGIGVATSHCNNLAYIGNHVYDCDRDGMMVSNNCQYVRVIGNDVHDVGDDCISVHSNPDVAADNTRDVLVANNIVGPFNSAAGTFGSNGIIGTGIRNLTIVGNVCWSNDMWGIAIWPEGIQPAENITIAGNVLHSATGASVTPFNPGHSANEGGGIALKIAASGTGGYGGAGQVSFIRNVTIVGNSISEPQSHGMWMYSLDATSKIRNVLINGNSFWGKAAATSESNGIRFNDSMWEHVSIRNNTFANWNNRAIRFQAGGAYLDISNNRIIDCCNSSTNSLAAFNLGSVDDVTLVGNRVMDLGTQHHLCAVDFGSAINVAMFNNNFRAGGISGTFTGTFNGRQANNINNAGTLYFPQTASGYVAGNMVS